MLLSECAGTESGIIQKMGFFDKGHGPPHGEWEKMKREGRGGDRCDVVVSRLNIKARYKVKMRFLKYIHSRCNVSEEEDPGLNTMVKINFVFIL